MGCLLGADGALRPVSGIGGAMLAGAPAVSGVISAACSNSFALVKTAGSVEVLDSGLGLLAQWDAPAGPALFALPPTGQIGFAYFAATGQLVQVDAQSSPRAVLDSQSLGGDVLAIASPDVSHVIAVVAETAGPCLVRISAVDGTIESQAPLEDAGAPLALLSDGTVVFADGAGLTIRPPGAGAQLLAQPESRLPVGKGQAAAAGEWRLGLPSPAVAIDQMSGSWLAVRLANSSAPVALRPAAGPQRGYRVPALEMAP